MTLFSISLGVEPGIETITSIIGTTIWGSSSLGVKKTAKAPRRRLAIMASGVSFESMKASVSLVRNVALCASMMWGS